MSGYRGNETNSGWPRNGKAETSPPPNVQDQGVALDGFQAGRVPDYSWMRRGGLCGFHRWCSVLTLQLLIDVDHVIITILLLLFTLSPTKIPQKCTPCLGVYVGQYKWLYDWCKEFSRNLILVMQPCVHNTFSKFTFEDGGSIASNKLNVMRQQPGTGRWFAICCDHWKQILVNMRSKGAILVNRPHAFPTALHYRTFWPTATYNRLQAASHVVLIVLLLAAPRDAQQHEYCTKWIVSSKFFIPALQHCSSTIWYLTPWFCYGAPWSDISRTQ